MAHLAGFYTLSGLAPSGTGDATFGVPIRLLKHLFDHGPTWKFNNIHVVSEILKAPAAIFEGLKRDGHEDSLCYSGVPSYRKESGAKVKWDGRFVTVVYVLPGTDHHKVVDWEYRVADAVDVGRPEDWEVDFERKLWPTR